MADPVTRGAARVATLVAVPVAIAAAIGVWAIAGKARPAADDPAPSPVSSAPVTVALPKIDEDQAVACRALLSALPDKVHDQPQRPVSEGAEQAAAYADPAVTLVCGVEAPKVADDATVYPMSGTCWLPATLDGATVWTTVDRAVPVAVTVPGDANGSGEWAQAFSKYVGEKLERAAENVPSGCG